MMRSPGRSVPADQPFNSIIVGEPASSQEGVEADDSDEAIVLAVRA